MTFLGSNIKWAVSDPGTDCWYSCSGRGGKCDFCGLEGYCCSATKLTVNGDCPTDIVQQLKTEFAAGGGHQCIAPNNGEYFTKYGIRERAVYFSG